MKTRKYYEPFNTRSPEWAECVEDAAGIIVLVLFVAGLCFL